MIGDADLAGWCAARDAHAAMVELQTAGIAAGRVQNGELLFNDDEQLRYRGLFEPLDSAVFGTRPSDRFPGRWSASTLEPYRVAPAYLGEHNFEVLTGIVGMSEEEIAVAMGSELLS